ncbi:PAS domain-containing protein [Nostoc sp. CHAB 5844]|nr:PAS domain-containing protein [Nostoc sp. CHAB 5844]
MLEFFKILLAYKQFIPHGHCYLWQSNLVGLHILSDILIVLAYYSIPLTLVYFARKRRDLPFNWIFSLFAVFIITCGTTHLIEIWTLWYPTYWLSGSIKAMTAVVSLYTALELIRLMPQALTVPSSAQLEVINQELEREINERQQVEAALRYSEERWHLAVSGTSEAIWDWNILTNQTFRSERWFEMLGYEPDELSSNDDEWSKRIHPDDYEPVIAAQQAYILQQTPDYNVEYRLRRKDGSYGWFRSRAKAVWDEQGNPVRLVGSLGETTDRKQVELVLQEREAMLRRIGDNLPNGAIYQVIRELDGSDRFYYLSAGIEKLMEVKAEDALKDSSLLYSQFIPEDVPRLQAAVDESMRILSVFDIQLRICTPSGQLKWFHFRSSPRHLDDGCVAWDGLVVDVTEIKRTEEILRKNEALLEESQRVARLGNWEYDLATGKVSWSKGLCELFKRDHQLSDPSYEENLALYHPEDREQLAQAVARAISTGKSYKLVLRAIRSDKVEIYVEGIGYAEFNATGKVIRLYGTIQDISDRIQAEEQLRRSEALLATAQKIAHVGSWEWNLSDARQIWSTETFRIFGLCPIQLAPTQAEFLQMVHPDDRPNLQAHFLSAIIDGTFLNIEYRIIRPDGSIRYLESRAEVAYDAQGNTINLFGAVLDITERKQTELEIIKSRDLREAIFNESADALFLVNPKTALTIDCNHRAVELFAASCKADLIGIAAHTLQKQQFSFQELANIVEQFNQQGFWSQEIEYITKQGNCFWGNIATKEIRIAEQVMNLVRVADISDRKRTEAALARSEEQQRLTLEFTDIGIWDWNIQTGEVIWNDNHFRLLGLDPETSVAKYHLWRDAVHPEDVKRVEQAVFQALAEHTNFEAEYRVILPNEEIRWLTGKGHGIYDPANQPIRMLGVIIDISEQQAALRDRQQAEAALRESEARFQAFMDNSPALAWITDAAGHLVYFNQAYLQILGLIADQIFGQSVFEIFPTEIAQQYFDNNQTVIQTNQVLEAVEIAPRKDGTLGKYLVYKFPIPVVSAQKLVGGVAIDITERQRAEQMLELQAIITRNMAEGICLVRADDGIFVYANPKFEQMFGYDTDELIGQHVSIVNYAEEQITAEEMNQAIRATVLQNGEATYEVHNVKKDGTSFWCSATACVFEHPEYGKVLVAVQQDITEQKQAEEQIKASLKEKEVLLKEIHHRVKNNLGIVSSLLQMQCRRTQDSQAKAILRDSQNRISSIALVHEKLYRSADLANIDFAQYIPDLTTHLFDSYNVTSNCIKLKIQVDNASLDIETAIPCGLIINELVSNALKYAFPDNCEGEIQVKLSQQNQSNLILIIRDNGVGLPADFESNNVKTLGITLVRGLVKQLKGTIEIDFQQGTEFKITFTKSRT